MDRSTRIPSLSGSHQKDEPVLRENAERPPDGRTGSSVGGMSLSERVEQQQHHMMTLPECGRPSGDVASSKTNQHLRAPVDASHISSPA